MQRGQFALTGTMVIGGKNTAFLRETAGGKSRRVLQGDTVNGILVADVKPDRVRLALGDETEELVLRVATNPRPTVQPVAQQAPAPVPTPVAGRGSAGRSRGCCGAAAARQPADASLAERRRAARAAQAAAQAQTSTPDGNPAPPRATHGPGAAGGSGGGGGTRSRQRSRSPMGRHVSRLSATPTPTCRDDDRAILGIRSAPAPGLPHHAPTG